MDESRNIKAVDYVDALADELGTPSVRIVVGGQIETAGEGNQAASSAMGGDIEKFDKDVREAIQRIAAPDELLAEG